MRLAVLIGALFGVLCCFQDVRGQTSFQQVRDSGFSSVIPPWTSGNLGGIRRFSQSPMIGDVLSSWRQASMQRAGPGGIGFGRGPQGAFAGNGASVSDVRNTFGNRFDFGFVPEQLRPPTPVSDMVQVGVDPGAANSLALLPDNAPIPFGGFGPQNLDPIGIRNPAARPISPGMLQLVPGGALHGPGIHGPAVNVNLGLGGHRDHDIHRHREPSGHIHREPEIHVQPGAHGHHGPEIHPITGVHVSELNHRPGIHHGSPLMPEGLGINHKLDHHEKALKAERNHAKLSKKEVKQQIKILKAEKRKRKMLGLAPDPTHREDLHALKDSLRQHKDIVSDLNVAIKEQKHIKKIKKAAEKHHDHHHGEVAKVVIKPHPVVHKVVHHHPPPPPPPPPPKKNNRLKNFAKALLVGGLGAMLLGK